MNTAPTRLFVCKIASRSKSSDGFAFVESGLPQAAEFGRHGMSQSGQQLTFLPFRIAGRLR
jgi:hypothetical protein